MSCAIFIRAWLIVVAFLITSIATSPAQVLYDGSLGVPSGQGWSYVPFGTAAETATNNGVLLDTSAAMSSQAGYTRIVPGSLNRTNGFALLFTAQVVSEAHADNTNRAGFSVILLAGDKHGIELAFWTNNIFAQSDTPLFAHAEETNYPTATAAVDYQLIFHATNYVLRANGAPVLSGPIRDYTAFSGFPNPYSTTNFLFFGDDTTSAGGVFHLKKVVLITAPQLVALRDGRIIWMGASNQTYTIRSSSNLVNWTEAGAVTSSTSDFVFTNTSAVSPRFFRLTYP